MIADATLLMCLFVFLAWVSIVGILLEDDPQVEYHSFCWEPRSYETEPIPAIIHVQPGIMLKAYHRTQVRRKQGIERVV